MDVMELSSTRILMALFPATSPSIMEYKDVDVLYSHIDDEPPKRPVTGFHPPIAATAAELGRHKYVRK
jgi:hypothetical protein